MRLSLRAALRRLAALRLRAAASLPPPRRPISCVSHHSMSELAKAKGQSVKSERGEQAKEQAKAKGQSVPHRTMMV